MISKRHLLGARDEILLSVYILMKEGGLLPRISALVFQIMMKGQIYNAKCS